MATEKTSKKTAKKAAPNKAVAKPKKMKLPEKFTATSMASYLSEKHELSKKQSKEIMEDMFEMIHGGVMMGERVPIGKLGKVFVKVKPATKSRMGRNPATGEEIKIAAKKATKVPKFTFAKTFKEEATKAKIKKK